jgi:hypothetical protein
LQNVHVSTNPGGQEIILSSKRVEGGNGGMNALQNHPATAADSHKSIFQRGSDNMRARSPPSGKALKLVPVS